MCLLFPLIKVRHASCKKVSWNGIVQNRSYRGVRSIIKEVVDTISTSRYVWYFRIVPPAWNLDRGSLGGKEARPLNPAFSGDETHTSFRELRNRERRRGAVSFYRGFYNTSFSHTPFYTFQSLILILAVSPFPTSHAPQRLRLEFCNFSSTPQVPLHAYIPTFEIAGCRRIVLLCQHALVACRIVASPVSRSRPSWRMRISREDLTCQHSNPPKLSLPAKIGEMRRSAITKPPFHPSESLRQPALLRRMISHH